VSGFSSSSIQQLQHDHVSVIIDVAGAIGLSQHRFVDESTLISGIEIVCKQENRK
jgi:hypothetical protein